MRFKGTQMEKNILVSAERWFPALTSSLSQCYRLNSMTSKEMLYFITFLSNSHNTFFPIYIFLSHPYCSIYCINPDSNDCFLLSFLKLTKANQMYEIKLQQQQQQLMVIQSIWFLLHSAVELK